MGNFVKKYNREINRVILHTSGGNQLATSQGILNYWQQVKEWKSPGYHKMVLHDGRVHEYSKPNQITNGVAGYNWDSYHICWVGGLHGIDNRTSRQRLSLHQEVKWAIDEFGKNIDILGHRDLSKDLDGNGIISPSEWSKQCPSFEVINWLNQTGLYNYLLS
jgi:N-acetylmuramoyl-L-alanine amidase